MYIYVYTNILGFRFPILGRIATDTQRSQSAYAQFFNVYVNIRLVKYIEKEREREYKSIYRRERYLNFQFLVAVFFRCGESRKIDYQALIINTTEFVQILVGLIETSLYRFSFSGRKVARGAARANASRIARIAYLSRSRSRALLPGIIRLSLDLGIFREPIRNVYPNTHTDTWE